MPALLPGSESFWRTTPSLPPMTPASLQWLRFSATMGYSAREIPCWTSAVAWGALLSNFPGPAPRSPPSIFRPGCCAARRPMLPGQGGRIFASCRPILRCLISMRLTGTVHLTWSSPPRRLPSAVRGTLPVWSKPAGPTAAAAALSRRQTILQRPPWRGSAHRAAFPSAETGGISMRC